MLEVALGQLETEVRGITRDIREVKNMLSTRYVSIEEFRPVKSLAYGLVGTVLLGVLVAVLALVVRSSGDHSPVIYQMAPNQPQPAPAVAPTAPPLPIPYP
jgi:hypothetical protein